MGENNRKARPRETWAESTRQAQRNYQKKARAKLCCDVSKETADSFRAFCADQGKSVSAVLGDYVKQLLQENDH